eukprot:CAMPEP_0201877728 /NCGR_PEP_ID=MMETSP0902-20130614/9073_1 /ASSEMBLY_ACC=CAM_ASM_000551 /TAXON_ID=420261 /ORGANISM="Thalassiosira antarctica, Strain CCMP982" /LENGTH=1207 /DNA_ID=CAMNT_0048405235 /DNA_START=83 /DNA_END=3706 /DNA_ORIENTATION=-
MVATTRLRTTPTTTITSLFLALLFTLHSANGNVAEYYCGTSWSDAAHSCPKHCPNGTDAECASLGVGNGVNYGCFYFTGCTEVAAGAGAGAGNGASSGVAAGSNGNSGQSPLIMNSYCGQSWLHAMLSCTDECPNGFECIDPNERCFAATNCNVPLEQLVSELVSTLQGPDTIMDLVDAGIFEGTLFDTFAAFAAEYGVVIGGVNLGDQVLVDRRELKHRMNHRALMGHDRYLNFDIRNVTQRMLPSGSSAVDVSMVVTGDYRPPPYIDLNVIAEDSINRNGAKVVSTLRERGARAGRDFFSRVEGIEAVAKADLTRRPTKAPTYDPTVSPIAPPTGFPSAMPTYFPSGTPSTAPSRPLDQVIMTGSREDLQLGGKTTNSYGYVFNIRTKPSSGVIILTGFDFYTLSKDEVTFELWTRLGSFKGHKGTFDGWDLVASGKVKGRGNGRYTSIPEELYTPVSIPGGGGEDGTRAFYLTLDSNQLVYKLGEVEEDIVAVSDSKSHADTEDLEIWEGEGILWYPFPDPSEVIYYRMPRQYLGAIYYNRLPCRPFSMYGTVNELPCPLVPTGAPTVPPPTKSPNTQPPSSSPVVAPTKIPSREPTSNPLSGQTPAPVEPTEFPTVSPTESKEPTLAPTTTQPTMSPVIPMRANVVTTLRNVPERSMTPREEEKYVDIMKTFLKRHTESSMVLDGIDLWHQELVFMDAKEGYVAVVDDSEEGGENEAQSPQVARGASRHLQRRKKPPEPIPQVSAMAITLILRISISNLPINLLGNMASVAIREHEQELLDLLREQQAFYTFFKTADGVSSRVIDDVTHAPSKRPTTFPHMVATQAALEAEALSSGEEEVDSGVGFGVIVGLGIGLLWCCLTLISGVFLIGARGEMEEERDMENLLKAEKANPLIDDDVNDVSAAADSTTKKDAAGNHVVDAKKDKKQKDSKLHRTSTVPLGNSEDDLDDWDHTNNTRLAPQTRVELRQSTRSKGEDGVDHEIILKKFGEEAKPKRNRMRSVIVTSQESRAMLDDDLKHRGDQGGQGGGGDLRGSIKKQLSQSMVLPKTDMSALEKSLAKNDEKVLKSSMNRGTRSIRQSQSMRSAKKGSHDTPAAGMRRSTATTHGSHDDLTSLRRSSTKGSHDNLASMSSRSSTKGSHEMRRSSKGSRDTPPTLKRSGTGTTKGSNNNGDTADIPTLRKSDSSIKKPNRRRSGSHGRSMIT